MFSSFGRVFFKWSVFVVVCSSFRSVADLLTLCPYMFLCPCGQLKDRLRGATEKLGPLNVANAESGRSSQQISAPGYSVKNVHPGNYGCVLSLMHACARARAHTHTELFPAHPPSKTRAHTHTERYGGEFTYGQSGDYGPLDKAVPANFLTTATWNFGREYRALRRFFGYEEFRELVDALSGAGAWEKARRGLEELVGGSGLDEKERKEKFAQAFRSMDKDGNGSVTGNFACACVRTCVVESAESKYGCVCVCCSQGAAGCVGEFWHCDVDGGGKADDCRSRRGQERQRERI